MPPDLTPDPSRPGGAPSAPGSAGDSSAPGSAGGAPPDAGPRGYLPPKAARRARKIVLREPMGLGWPVAAVVAMVVLVGVAVAFVVLRTGPPAAPFVAVGPVAAVPQGSAGVLDGAGTDVLVVRAGGRFRVFAAPGGAPAYCDASRRLEAPDGAVWTLDGAAAGRGAASLTPLPSAVHDGTVYVDPTAPGAALPAAGDESPACTAPASAPGG